MAKHEIPLLEFDGTRSAVFSPDREKSGLRLPQKCLFAFCGTSRRVLLYTADTPADAEQYDGRNRGGNVKEGARRLCLIALTRL